MKNVFYFLILIPYYVISQDYPAGTIQNKNVNSISTPLNPDVSKLRELIYGQVPSNYKEDKRDRQTFLFAHNKALEICDLINSGQVYSNKYELELYLNAILKKVIPEDLKKDTTIHVIVLKNGNDNAEMAPTGQIIMNIGLLAEVDNEAMIACVFAHEIAHYYLKHSIITNIKSLKNRFGTRYYFNSHKFSDFSINNEYESDSLAAYWVYKSGYDILEMKHIFLTMTRSENQSISKLKDKWQLDETTHPLSAFRLAKINDFIERYKENQGELFLVDRDKFNTLREESKPEILRLLLKDFNYYQCIDKAFVFHIIDPFNKSYIYYLMEAIRRLCYSNISIWNELFLTNQYYDSLKVNGILTKVKTKNNLFSSFNTDYLSLNPEDTNNIKARFYWQGDPKFTTYEQAFEYFYEISQQLKINECILTNALSLSKNKIARNRFLEKYLLKDSIKYREFAENLLNDSIYYKLDTTKLLVIADFSASLKLINENLKIPKQPGDSLDIIQFLVDSLSAKLPGRKLLSLAKLKESNPDDYFLLKNLHKNSFYPTVSVGDKIELAILDPDYWKIFNYYNVNEIEFMMCNYSDAMGGTRTVDYYKSLINRGYTELFYPPQHRRFMEVYITSVRMKKQGAMKIRYFYSTHFGNLAVGVPEILEELNLQIKEKEIYSIKLDKISE